MMRAVVLLSGGLDSTTCLAYASSQNYQCAALSFDYGQRQRYELQAAKNIAKMFAVLDHKIMRFPLEEISNSVLTNEQMAVPEYCGDGKIPATYVPARNSIFIAVALAWAETLSAEKVFIGASAVDYSGYPDCRPEHIAAFQNVANLATKCGVEGNGIIIEAPLLDLSKAETIKLGVGLGLDYSLTVSCYDLNEKGQACGRCDSCVLRRNGFIEANLADPTNYV